MTDLRQRGFGPSDRPISELTDAELEAELLRRRRERAKGRSEGRAHRSTDKRGSTDKRAERRRDEQSPQDKQLAQAYANLELEPGASLEEVKRKYRELMRKYHPDKYLGQPERHRAATELAQSLTEAYREVRAHIERRG